MNTKLKIALLAMLGLSTAACCSTKKAKRSDNGQNVTIEDELPRAVAMYAAPMPYDQLPELVEEPQLQRPGGIVSPVGSKVFIVDASVAEQVASAYAAIVGAEGAEQFSQSFHALDNGKVVIVVPDAIAEQFSAAVEATNLEIAPETEGVPFPDGSVAAPLTEERIAEIFDMIAQEEATRNE